MVKTLENKSGRIAQLFTFSNCLVPQILHKNRLESHSLCEDQGRNRRLQVSNDKYKSECKETNLEIYVLMFIFCRILMSFSCLCFFTVYLDYFSQVSDYFRLRVIIFYRMVNKYITYRSKT